MRNIIRFTAVIAITIAVAVTVFTVPLATEARADHWKQKGYNACIAAGGGNGRARYCQGHSVNAGVILQRFAGAKVQH